MNQTVWCQFAAAALGGLAANENTGCNSATDFAHWSAQAADAMLAEFQKRVEQDRARSPMPVIPQPTDGRRTP